MLRTKLGYCSPGTFDDVLALPLYLGVDWSVVLPLPPSTPRAPSPFRGVLMSSEWYDRFNWYNCLVVDAAHFGVGACLSSWISRPLRSSVWIKSQFERITAISDRHQTTCSKRFCLVVDIFCGDDTILDDEAAFSKNGTYEQTIGWSFDCNRIFKLINTV